MSQKIIALIALLATLVAVVVSYALKLPDIAVLLGVLGTVTQAFCASLRDSTNVKAAKESIRPGSILDVARVQIPTPPPIPRESRPDTEETKR